MADARIIIGNKRFSSWSLRGWLAVKLAGIDAAEEVVPLHAGFTPALASLSPNRLVPVLHHRGLTIWETMAICEYCAEVKPSLWPRDAAARAYARSIAAEMHAGFSALRSAMPMDLCKP
ncbi:MAG: glutathione S-transferase, partial [Pseudomonadota bacterium]|nr:glutathione S-transferase [Pseudomonadota bacterium]